ncbi:hypothetical protein [Lichenibacterium dinghuense]|uniref:hypothetical protein n=1 Tax=Lichenibacterium dinghuense TaxID=2895977 RepID=UPI001F22EE23|nr:hypothetical protein [Lichenibacterium sp. 6Y81]
MRTLLALLLCLALGACANADGSRPRLSADAPSGAAGFNGGYAGANYGFSNLNTKATPF